MADLSRPEIMKRLSTSADLVAAMIAAVGVLPETDQVEMIETCRSMADNLARELSTLKNRSAQ